jgi:hypothetical protein
LQGIAAFNPSHAITVPAVFLRVMLLSVLTLSVDGTALLPNLTLTERLAAVLMEDRIRAPAANLFIAIQ